MGAQERYLPREQDQGGFPYLFVDRVQVSRPTALGGHSMSVLMAIGTREDGSSGMVGATIILDSLEQAWDRLLRQLRAPGTSGVRLFVASAPEACQALALRCFPHARWQSPLKSYYEAILQNVPPRHAAAIESSMRSIHTQPDRGSAEHAAAATVGALTAIGLWETGIEFATTYPQTLTYFEFPAHLRQTLRDNDAFDSLIDSFIQTIAATGQFRGCAIRRMNQFESEPDVMAVPAPASEVATEAIAMPVAPVAAAPALVPVVPPVAAVVSATPITTPLPEVATITAAPLAEAGPVYEEIVLTDIGASLPAVEELGTEDLIEEDLVAHPFGVPLPPEDAPSQNHQQRPSPVATTPTPAAAQGTNVVPPRLQWRTRLTSVPAQARSGTTATPAKTLAPQPSVVAAKSAAPTTPQPGRREPVVATARALPARSPAAGRNVPTPPSVVATRRPAQAASADPIRRTPSPTPVIAPLPTKIEPVAARVANATPVTEPIAFAPAAGSLFEPHRALSWRRYAAVGGAALGINLAIFGVALALMKPVETLSASGPSQFVQVIDFLPASADRPLPVPVKKGLFTSDTAVAAAAPPRLPFKPITMSALPPPPLDLAPAGRVETDLPPTRIESRTTSAAAAPSTDRETASSAATTVASGLGDGGNGSGTAGNGEATGAPKPRPAPVMVNASPDYRVAPDYPADALNAGIEGVVTIEFEIASDGTVRDPRIVEAVPPGIFDTAALKAIKKWRYTAQADDGGDIRRARQSMLFSLRH